MKLKALVAGLLAIFLSIGQLEASGFGHVGARGFGHFKARGYGQFRARGFSHFGHYGAGGFAVGIQSHGYGYRSFRNGYCPPFYDFRSDRAGFPFGYYMPFYLYDNYSVLNSETLTSAPDYYRENSSSQPNSGNASETQARPWINSRTDCRDSWAGEHQNESLSNLIRSVFEQQCENGHPATDPNRPREDRQD
jgi:hypothetical protein